MGVIRNQYQITLYNDRNQTIEGSVLIEGYVPDMQVPHIGNDTSNLTLSNNDSSTLTLEVFDDPNGEVMYVVTVILVYGLAIIFMIASHVFAKQKEERLENQLRYVEKYYFEEQGSIRDRGARESYKKLKYSIIPAVAQSTARDLISRRKSFAPFLIQAGFSVENGVIGRRLSEEDHRLIDARLPTVDSDEEISQPGEDDVFSNEKNYIKVPSFLELPPSMRMVSLLPPAMPSISEESASSGSEKVEEGGYITGGFVPPHSEIPSMLNKANSPSQHSLGFTPEDTTPGMNIEGGIPGIHTLTSPENNTQTQENTPPHLQGSSDNYNNISLYNYESKPNDYRIQPYSSSLSPFPRIHITHGPTHSQDLTHKPVSCDKSNFRRQTKVDIDQDKHNLLSPTQSFECASIESLNYDQEPDIQLDLKGKGQVQGQRHSVDDADIQVVSPDRNIRKLGGDMNKFQVPKKRDAALLYQIRRKTDLDFDTRV